MTLAGILGDRAHRGQFWTHSLTLVSGCTKVSEGCQHCWSEAMHKRFQKDPFDVVRTHDLRLVQILPHPSGPRRKPRIWTYWNDLFHGAVGDWFRDNLFETISLSSDTHIICTKRPEEAVRYFSERPRRSIILDNVILLVTMENQKWANERGLYASHLAKMGWRVGALVEPMLGPVSLVSLEYGFSGPGDMLIDSLCWVICGPENGRGKRPFHDQWAMRLQQEAKTAGVPFFYKAGLLNGKRYAETP